MPTALNQLLDRLRSDALRHDSADVTDGELLECYVALRDEVAFEVLVRRHGPMVFGVCRRILQNDADAEDAFQATFLVLVRKAATIRPRGMVGNWLYGVAHNTALKARAMIHQRRAKETEAGTTPNTESNRETLEHMQSVLDEELSRLPDKYRVPIILCDLEGKTIKEVVHHLGWPQGTVASRLTRGRALLAKRLAKHGLILSAGLLAILLSQSAASASVPAALTATTVQAAGLFAAGQTGATGASATALALTDGVLKTMLFVKLKVATAVVVLAAIFVAGISGFTYSRWAGKQAHAHWRVVMQKSTPTERPPQESRASIVPPVADDPSEASSHASISPLTPSGVPAQAPSAPGNAELAGAKPPAAALPRGDNVKAKVIVIRGPESVNAAPPDKAKQTEPPKHWRAFAVRLSPDGRVLEKLWVVLPRGQIFVIQPSAKEVRQIITGTHSWLSSASFPAINAKGIKVVGATNRVEVTIRVHEINATSLKVFSATMGDWLFTDVPVPPVPPPSAGAADDVSFAPHPSPMRIETQNTDG